jgi:cytochrome c553
MIKHAIVAVAVSMVAASAGAAGNAERGKAKADQACAACHAVGGDWNKPLQPEYPRLGGQHKDYLVTALNAYKQGDRSTIGRKNAIMAGQAAALSKQEIEDIATFLSGLSGPMHVKR